MALKTKKQKSRFPRASGVLMHMSSLPCEYGIGDFGSTAYRFADFLAQARQTYWQILPLTPTDPIYGNSPYSSNSAFAMNVLFVSPEMLLKDGWVTPEEVKGSVLPSASTVDYPSALAYKQRLLDAAFSRVKDRLPGMKEFQNFCKEQSAWLDDYALFIVFKMKFNGQIWTQWPSDVKNREGNALERVVRENWDDLSLIKFGQFVLYRQWKLLKDYCRRQKVQIVGDIPIYVNDDSVDVWSNPTIFKLGENRQPRFVAGVPPDYFSQTGQRWGNPVYDWDVLKSMEYAWWFDRLRHNLELYDVIRIDHFRGFVDFWQIPAEAPTAETGEWQLGPSDDFFEAIQENFPNLPLIAEDLGILSPAVPEAMERFQFPGMKILLFAFGGELEKNPYPPDKYTPNCVAYTGTHDNNTIYGWWEHDASMEEKKNLARYLRKHKIKKQGPLHWFFIDLLMKSDANVVIFPLQDILGLNGEARMNVPGTGQGNWGWRLQEKSVNAAAIKKLRQLTETTKRG